jgi:hypothetical protein
VWFWRFLTFYFCIRRFSSSFDQLRIDHRRIKNTRNSEAIGRFEADKFKWPSVESEALPVIAEQTAPEDVSADIPAESGNTFEEVVEEPTAVEAAERSSSRPAVSMTGRAIGEK